MKNTVLILLLGLLASVVGATAKDKAPYIGEWSNGRGETLIITATTIQFIDNKPVPYTDITEEGEASFTLQLNASGKLNYLSKFMQFTIAGKEEMKSEGYDSADDDAESVSQATWFRDK